MQKLVDKLAERLQDSLQPTFLNIIDDSDEHAGHAGNQGGAHLTVHIVSAQFDGKLPVARHRMVYAALNEWMNKEIHALSIHAQTPLEYITTRTQP